MTSYRFSKIFCIPPAELFWHSRDRSIFGIFTELEVLLFFVSENRVTVQLFIKVVRAASEGMGTRKKLKYIKTSKNIFKLRLVQRILPNQRNNIISLGQHTEQLSSVHN